jgi:arylsulfatase A-like enzyme
MSDKKPNIIFIITDQQRYDTISALGYPHVDTPNLDRLVKEGTHFTDCHVAGASCVPARASLFTGLYPHSTGILKNADLWRHSWVELFQEAGYHTVNVGKMHTWPLNTPAGFNERYNVENKDRFLEGRYYFDEWDRALAANGMTKQQRETYRARDDYKERLGAFDWELPERLHSDMFVGGMAAWWVNSYPTTEPLFLQVGFPGPHPPYDPTTEFSADYMGRDIPIEPVLQNDLDGQPAPFKSMRIHNAEVDHDSVVHQLDPSAEARHKQRAYYLANVTMIDKKVGELIEALDRKGYLENSVIVFTSDHGDCLGDHGHSQKWTMYEQVTNVPMIVWSPGRVAAGHQVDSLMQQMDIVPALLNYAGIDTPEIFESKSALAALEGKEWQDREYAYCEQSRDGILQDTEFMTMIRSKDWKLVHFLGEEFGQLFDLNNDPTEVDNKWDDPAAQDIKRKILDHLLFWRIESQHHTRDFSREHR